MPGGPASLLAVFLYFVITQVACAAEKANGWSVCSVSETGTVFKVVNNEKPLKVRIWSVEPASHWHSTDQTDVSSKQANALPHSPCVRLKEPAPILLDFFFKVIAILVP